MTYLAIVSPYIAALTLGEGGSLLGNYCSADLLAKNFFEGEQSEQRDDIIELLSSLSNHRWGQGGDQVKLLNCNIEKSQSCLVWRGNFRMLADCPIAVLLLQDDRIYT